MSYLARLRSQNSGNGLPSLPTKLTEGASVGSVSTEASRFSKIETAVAAAVPVAPEDWYTRMSGHRPPDIAPDCWSVALTVLSDLIEGGTVADALALGWSPLEVIGLQRRLPHDAPHVAGLVYSVRLGERVRLLTDKGCTIVTETGPHRWLRVPLSSEVVVAPWELPL
jgi:hypothetical protein